MSYLWAVWFRPRVQLSAVDEIVMFLEVVVVMGVLVGAYALVSVYIARGKRP